MILIGQDNTRDCSIMSGDAPGGLEIDLGCHGYDSITRRSQRLPRSLHLKLSVPMYVPTMGVEQ